MKFLVPNDVSLKKLSSNSLDSTLAPSCHGRRLWKTEHDEDWTDDELCLKKAPNDVQMKEQRRKARGFEAFGQKMQRVKNARRRE